MGELADIAKRDVATGTQRTAVGLWTAKEAILKALGNAGASLQDASKPLCDIELCRQEGGSLRVDLHGSARAAAEKVGIAEARVSVTYAGDIAYAAAVLV